MHASYKSARYCIKQHVLSLPLVDYINTDAYET